MLAEKLLPVAKGAPSDPYFYDVSLLLTGDGTNGAQNNTFLDSSTNNFTITRNGNTTQGSFSPFGTLWSNYFDGSGDYLSAPYAVTTTEWWTQDFTMEMWVFNNTNAVSGTSSLCLQLSHGVYNSTSTFWAFGTDASGHVDFYYYNGAGVRLTSTATAALNTWNHIAMVYTNSTGNISLYLNGTSVASATKSGTPQKDASNTLNIGVAQSTYYNGYISNLRILDGTALYSGSFTPSTTPLTAIANTAFLTCQSNRFIDNSSNAFAITVNGNTSIQRFSPFNPTAAYDPAVIGGSGYFDGTNDYLTVPSNAAFDIGSGAMTIEAWVYPTASATSVIVTRAANGSSYPTWELDLFSLQPQAYFSSTGSSYALYILSSTNVVLNTWNHIAVARSGSSFRMWLNGVSVGTGTSSASMVANGSAVGIGCYPNAANDFPGYITDVRVVKGTAVYDPASSTITVPTAPLTAITNTSLLCNMTNAGIPDSAMMNDLETVGNAQVSTSVKKYGTGSLAFDGTGDYLDLSNNPIYAFGTGDFTLEMWLYHTSNSAQRIIGNYVSSGNTEFDIEFAANGTIYFGSYLTYTQTSTAVSLNTWTHIAWVRSSGVETFYINGVSAGSATRSLNFSSTTGPRIGGSKDLTTNLYVGYIDDLRITKGYARYTANFTPPTTALPTY